MTVEEVTKIIRRKPKVTAIHAGLGADHRGEAAKQRWSPSGPGSSHA